MSQRTSTVLFLGCLASLSIGQTGPPSTPSRGELLYTTHCVACHTAQVHWREQKLVTDWNSLKAQVRRWQGTAQLGWSEADIVEVARHLNELHYRFAQTSNVISLATPR